MKISERDKLKEEIATLEKELESLKAKAKQIKRPVKITGKQIEEEPKE